MGTNPAGLRGARSVWSKTPFFLESEIRVARTVIWKLPASASTTPITCLLLSWLMPKVECEDFPILFQPWSWMPLVASRKPFFSLLYYLNNLEPSPLFHLVYVESFYLCCLAVIRNGPCRLPHTGICKQPFSSAGSDLVIVTEGSWKGKTSITVTQNEKILWISCCRKKNKYLDTCSII